MSSSRSCRLRVMRARSHRPRRSRSARDSRGAPDRRDTPLLRLVDERAIDEWERIELSAAQLHVLGPLAKHPRVAPHEPGDRAARPRSARAPRRRAAGRSPPPPRATRSRRPDRGRAGWHVGSGPPKTIAARDWPPEARRAADRACGQGARDRREPDDVSAADEVPVDRALAGDVLDGRARGRSPGRGRPSRATRLPVPSPRERDVEGWAPASMSATRPSSVHDDSNNFEFRWRGRPRVVRHCPATADAEVPPSGRMSMPRPPWARLDARWGRAQPDGLRRAAHGPLTSSPRARAIAGRNPAPSGPSRHGGQHRRWRVSHLEGDRGHRPPHARASRRSRARLGGRHPAPGEFGGLRGLPSGRGDHRAAAARSSTSSRSPGRASDHPSRAT